VVDDPIEHQEALRTITEHVVSSWSTTRPPSPGELRATRVIALPLKEVSAKVRTGGAINEADDSEQPYWSGHVPIVTRFGTPVDNPDASAAIPEGISELEGRDVHGVADR